MAYQLGRTVNLGIARETTRGTLESAAEFWEKHAELEIDDKFEASPIDTAFGQIEDADDSIITKKWMEGSVRSHVKAQSIGLWLYSLLGGYAVAGVGGESVVYDHTLTVAQTNIHQSLSIYTNDTIQDYKFANCVVSDFELILEAGKFCDFKAKFVGKNGATATNSVSFSADDKLFIAKMATVKQATDSSGLGAASAIPIHTLSFKINPNVETEYILGSVSPNEFLNKQFQVEAELELYYQSEATFKTGALASTSGALQITLANTDVTIGSTSNPTITITLYKFKAEELSRDLGVDGIVRQKVKLKGMYSSSDTKMLQIVVRNLIATYAT